MSLKLMSQESFTCMMCTLGSKLQTVTKSRGILSARLIYKRRRIR